MSPIIRFDQVSVAVREKVILSNISFALFPGEKVVLCGKSGSGKSSVLRTFIGLHAVAAGDVYFQQMQLTAASVHSIRNATAYIGQEPVLGAETVREALLLPFQFKAHRNQRPSDARLIEVLNRLHLTADILNQKSSHISGGEKQRIALARGLLLGKSLYLLDEITSALDAESKQAVFDVFSDSQLTVLSVAHDKEWLVRCDRILELEAGRLVGERTHGNA
ncbi:ATP-binding cassette domain-containing protein [Methylotuvimicrobium buryatense]|uniref:ATP-binding cassette domain-containing protein n=1 Tax=Methylotuvimicrobium buryatense TaxID=95641 RepID=A0A4P9UJG9_METBY|nr:ATP-binding cassette domain-containing protein [Methylotuvimicrobium buryatense]QCW81342.1 ATP-binding cassette domain-containing protein [Methylotuvimicrobium buryatense]